MTQTHPRASGLSSPASPGRTTSSSNCWPPQEGPCTRTFWSVLQDCSNAISSGVSPPVSCARQGAAAIATLAAECSRGSTLIWSRSSVRGPSWPSTMRAGS